MRTGPHSPSSRHFRTGDTGMQCQACEKTLQTRYDLEEHYCNHFMKDLAAQFPQSVAALECELCGARFTRKRNLLHYLGCRLVLEKVPSEGS